MKSRVYLGIAVLLVVVTGACVSPAVMRPDRHGGAQNPITTDGIQEQRSYLRRLRLGEEKQRVHHEYIQSEPGLDGTILDVFEIDHYEKDECTASSLDRLLDHVREIPLCPNRLRIYMNMYGKSQSPGEPVPGYQLIPLH